MRKQHGKEHQPKANHHRIIMNETTDKPKYNPIFPPLTSTSFQDIYRFHI